MQNYFWNRNSINCFLGDSLRDYTPEQIQKMPEIIKSITQDDIKNVMEKYLDLNKVSLVVSHPSDKENKVSFKGKLEKKIDVEKDNKIFISKKAKKKIEDKGGNIKEIKK